MKIAHLASYNINIGDNITVCNVRRDLGSFLGSINVDWKSVNILDFFEQRNAIDYCIERFSVISEECDAIIIGGGGLIEGGAYSNYETGWKLPFNKDILNVIQIPIFCVSLGINYFWGEGELNDCGINNLSLLIEKSVNTSFRLDGSYQIARKLLGEDNAKFCETSDPGCFTNAIKSRESLLTKGFLQPAWNKKEKINQNRFGGSKNIDKLLKIANKFNLNVFPHTPKDFNFPLSNHHFSEPDNFMVEKCSAATSKYLDCDYVLAMRGHGQIISFGMNIPGIYLATQDKLIGWAEQSLMTDYLVDIRETNWDANLLKKLDMLQNSRSYLNNWYEIRDRRMREITPKYKSYISNIADHMVKS